MNKSTRLAILKELNQQTLSSLIDICINDKKYSFNDLDDIDKQSLTAALLERKKNEAPRWDFEMMIAEIMEDHLSQIGTFLIEALGPTDQHSGFMGLNDLLAEVIPDYFEEEINELLDHAASDLNTEDGHIRGEHQVTDYKERVRDYNDSVIKNIFKLD